MLIDDKDMSGNIDETTQFITDTKSNQVALLDEIISRATMMYNEKQEELNRQAQYKDQKVAERIRTKKITR